MPKEININLTSKQRSKTMKKLYKKAVKKIARLVLWL